MIWILKIRYQVKFKKDYKRVIKKGAIKNYLKKCILEQGIPFELKVPNRETLKAMQETDDILSDKIERKGCNSAEELFEDLGV